MKLSLDHNHLDTFLRDGFVIVPDVLEQPEIDAVLERIEPLFSGDFPTGLRPDEWNWQMGKSPEGLTRQICNAWKSDPAIAEIVLDPQIGRANSYLRGWPGARINQDNIIWKPPGCKALGFHQDESYQRWHLPGEMNTVWINLDDTSVKGGTIEYVRGSHMWPLAPPIEQFHAPDNPTHDMEIAARLAGAIPDIVPIVVKAGSAVIHHGRTWHGSRGNSNSKPRRSVVSHCMPSQSRFSDTTKCPIYSRYRLINTDQMDESFFPILWESN